MVALPAYREVGAVAIPSNMLALAVPIIIWWQGNAALGSIRLRPSQQHQSKAFWAVAIVTLVADM